MKHKVALGLSGFAAGICNGLFGSGGGMIVVPCLEKFRELPTKKAHSTAVLVIAPLALVSVFRYVGFTETDKSILFTVSLAGIVGSFIGAKLMKKVKGKLIRRIFACFIIIAAVRMVMA